ncbi:MAG: hypothetical protein AAB551_00765, partial [Patescibacteria group bacterium]
LKTELRDFKDEFYGFKTDTNSRFEALERKMDDGFAIVANYFSEIVANMATKDELRAVEARLDSRINVIFETMATKEDIRFVRIPLYDHEKRISILERN